MSGGLAKMRIGGMVWRVGEVLDLYEQIAWFGRRGFEGIAFHTAPCFSGEWASFDVRRATPADRQKLRRAVAGFAEVGIHAEFDNYDVSLCTPNELVRRASVETLRPSIELAAEVGAAVVTVHEGATRTGAPDAVRREALARSIDELAELAGAAGVSIGLELVGDYDLALAPPAHIGVTLDTGHVCMRDGAGYREHGSIGGLIHHLGARLVHVHAHDYDGRTDHLAIGAGRIDFVDVCQSLGAIGFGGMVCLELNPDRTAPADYSRSRDALLALSGGWPRGGEAGQRLR